MTTPFYLLKNKPKFKIIRMRNEQSDIYFYCWYKAWVEFGKYDLTPLLGDTITQ